MHAVILLRSLVYVSTAIILLGIFIDWDTYSGPSLNSTKFCDLLFELNLKQSQLTIKETFMKILYAMYLPTLKTINQCHLIAFLSPLVFNQTQIIYH